MTTDVQKFSITGEPSNLLNESRIGLDYIVARRHKIYQKSLYSKRSSGETSLNILHTPYANLQKY